MSSATAYLISRSESYNVTMINMELRRKNLQRLVGKYEGQAKLMRKINENIKLPEKCIIPSQISQILSGRTMGERMCRKIEDALKLPMYWLDMSEKDQKRLAIDDKSLKLLEAINSLHPSQREALTALINPDDNEQYEGRILNNFSE